MHPPEVRLRDLDDSSTSEVAQKLNPHPKE
jgi:hypothetical protein